MTDRCPRCLRERAESEASWLDNYTLRDPEPAQTCGVDSCSVSARGIARLDCQRATIARLTRERDDARARVAALSSTLVTMVREHERCRGCAGTGKKTDGQTGPFPCLDCNGTGLSNWARELLKEER